MPLSPSDLHSPKALRRACIVKSLPKVPIVQETERFARRSMGKHVSSEVGSIPTVGGNVYTVRAADSNEQRGNFGACAG